MTVPDCGTWRKMRDSNPRYPEEGIPDFESSAFGHSANLPFILSDAKVIHFLHLTKYCCYFLTILTPLYRILYYIEVSHVGKLREVREVRGKLRDKCPKFKQENYCLLTSRTTVGSDNFFNSFNFLICESSV